MAEEQTPAPGADPNQAPKAPLPILPLINSVALLATAGFLYYSKLVFKRPVITEESERERLEALHASPTPPPAPMLINFDPITVNIKAITEQIPSGEGTGRQEVGKPHFATVGFSVEIRDRSQQDLFESIKPVVSDHLIQTLGKKQFHELTTVQGRYLLMSEMLDFTNHFIVTHSLTPSKEPLVTNIFFTQFIVQ